MINQSMDRLQFTAAEAAVFNETVTKAVLLISTSPDEADRPISFLQDTILPAIFLKQFRLYADTKTAHPIGFLAYASVSDEIKARLEEGAGALAIPEWRSGPHIVTVCAIAAPGGDSTIFVEKFKAELGALRAA